MKCLIVEDDPVSSKLLQTFISGYGDCTIVVNGLEAVEAVGDALDKGQPYDLICLDIMLPEMDGHNTLKEIRQIEKDHAIDKADGAKVVMTTALSDVRNIGKAFATGCEAYLVKPYIREELLKRMKKFGLIESETSK